MRAHWLLPYCLIIYANASTSTSNINLNLSPNSQNGGSKTSNLEQSSANAPLVGGLVSLDLAGKVNIHVSSPRDVDHRTPPLLIWGGRFNPSIFVGAKYDFSKFWYGATSLLTTLSWGKGSLQNKSEDSRNRKMPVTADVKTEICTDVEKAGDCSIELELGFPRKDSKLSILSFRLEKLLKGTCPSVMLSTNVHPRFQLVSRAHFPLETKSREIFSSRIPEMWTKGTALKMTPTGKVCSISGMNLNGRGDRLHNIGVRLMARKQLNWNLFGLVSERGNDLYETNDTAIRLEVSQIMNNGYTMTSLSVEAALERMKDTLRYTMKHERII